jgi:D-lactate dehydrogenase
LRNENHSPFQNSVALFIAKNFALTEMLVRAGIKIGVHRLFSQSRLMKYVRSSPRIPENKNNHAQVIYFPSCVTRTMGAGLEGKHNLMQAFISICNKVGLQVSVPDKIQGSCCSQIFSSKGFYKAYRYKANDIVDRLWEASHSGKIPVVTDVSSCAYTLQNLRNVISPAHQSKFDRMKMLDSVEFLHDMVMPLIKNVKPKGSIVLHPVCSLQKMGTWHKFVTVARFFAGNVTVPANAGCCGMAGDRGFTIPELTASATAQEAAEVKKERYDGYYSSTKTCEIAMSDAVGMEYESILYLVDECI